VRALILEEPATLTGLADSLRTLRIDADGLRIDAEGVTALEVGADFDGGAEDGTLREVWLPLTGGGFTIESCLM
jgi:hypothetical protein